MTAVTLTPQAFMYGLWSAWGISWWIAAIWSDRSVQRPGRRRQLVYRALMTLGWYIKARMEEGFLHEQLGADADGSYARRVPMLVPFVRPR